MKTTTIKTFVVLLCMTLGFANAAKGQIYESEACFYAPAGSSSVSRIVRFEGSRNLVWVKTCFNRNKLAESKYYYENEKWTDDKDCVQMYEYDYSMSTSQRTVYKREQWRNYVGDMGCPYCSGWGEYRTSCGRHGKYLQQIQFVAFSKDKSSFISWYQYPNDVDNKIRSKSTFTRVPKEDLLPKAANYDFLNE